MSSRTILGIALMIVAVALFIMGTKPFWDNAQSLISRKTELQNTLSKIQDMRSLYKGIKDKYDSIPKEDLSRLDQMLPDSPEEALLLVNIENMSKASGIKLNNIGLGGAAPKLEGGEAGRNYGSLPVNISLTASYESFRSFLRTLETSRRLLDVDQIAFSSSKTDSYQFTIQASAHFKGKNK